MKNKNTQSGITLIALVVTIVVLLILAGITIAFVLSDGGIFQSAKDAKVEQMRATIMDYAVQIQPTVTAKYYANGAEGEILLTSSYKTYKDKTKEQLEEEFREPISEVIDLQSFFPGYTVFEEDGFGSIISESGVVYWAGFYVVNGNSNIESADINDIFSVIFDWNGNVTVENGKKLDRLEIS